MNRFFQFIDQLPKPSQLTQVKVGIDLGSVHTRIRVGNTLKRKEPTCMVMHSRSQHVVAIGRQAKKLQTGNHQQISLCAPLANGVVTDIPLAASYLKMVLSKALKLNEMSLFTYIDGYCVIPSSLTQVERLIFERTFESLGMGRWRFVSKAQIWQKLLLGKGPHGGYGGSIDIGGDTTELVLLAGTNTTRAATIPFGGKTLVKQLQQLVREQYNCDISWMSASKILESLVLTQAGKKEKPSKGKLAVRGKSILTGKPETVTVESSVFEKQIRYTFLELIEDIELFFAQIPAEIVTRTFDQGLVLSGEVSQIAGLADLFKNELHITCSVSKTPGRDLIVGLW
jgi:rod shape-determining protein MreB and related proteins